MKVFVETSPLLAASIYYEGKVSHKHYSYSKALFNYFNENIKQQIGITSDTVTKQAQNRLLKAITDCVRETKDINQEEIELISHIKDDSEDRLTENIKLLLKYPLNDAIVEKIQNNEVTPFFWEVKDTQKESGEFIVEGFRLKHSTKNMITRMNTPYFKSIPDFTDKRILSEAIFIKREIIPQEELLLVSLDTHFSPPKKDTIIRDKIYTAFKIYCDWPEQIMKKIKQLN